MLYFRYPKCTPLFLLKYLPLFFIIILFYFLTDFAECLFVIFGMYSFCSMLPNKDAMLIWVDLINGIVF